MKTKHIPQVSKKIKEKLPAKSWGGFIYSYRKHYGITQASLAERVRRSRPSVVMWETGKVEPSLSEVVVILARLDLTLIDYGRYLESQDEN